MIEWIIEWKPVEVVEPTEYGTYLVTYEGRYMPRSNLTTKFVAVLIFDPKCGWIMPGYLFGEHVIAWDSLPEPYEVEE